MNDWVIILSNEEKPHVHAGYRWANIDAATAKVAALQLAHETSEVPDGDFSAAVADLEHAILAALACGVSVRALSLRTDISQNDISRVQSSGRLYER